MLSYLRSYSPSPVSELHRVFGIKRSTLTSMLDRLASRGWLARSPSTRDRRVILVSLTEGGRVRAYRIQTAVDELEARIGADLNEEEPAGFYAVMSAIAAATQVTVTHREGVGAPGAREEETS
jgi:DNA-binding MarR family transcriptional regulator